MTAAPQSIQPTTATPRRDPPVCCYCDTDLSCAACGHEQPYTDISIVKSEADRFKAALKAIDEHLDNFGYPPAFKARKLARAALQSERAL